MIFDFLITLKKKNQQYIDWVNYFLYTIAIATFAFLSFSVKKNVLYFTITIVCLITWWVYCIYLKLVKEETPYFRLGLLIAAIAWFQHPVSLPFIGLLYILAALAEKQAKFPFEIGFNEELILINSFPKKKFQWNELNNALIKDGILTVDLKNNVLIQREIEDEVSAEIEKEFNDFCKQQLQLNNEKNISK